MRRPRDAWWVTPVAMTVVASLLWVGGSDGALHVVCAVVASLAAAGVWVLSVLTRALKRESDAATFVDGPELFAGDGPSRRVRVEPIPDLAPLVRVDSRPPVHPSCGCVRVDPPTGWRTLGGWPVRRRRGL